MRKTIEKSQQDPRQANTSPTVQTESVIIKKLQYCWQEYKSIVNSIQYYKRIFNVAHYTCNCCRKSFTVKLYDPDKLK